MFERDYLMQLIWQLAQAIRVSWGLDKDSDPDPQASADVLEAAIGTATDLDGATLLSLAPESMAGVLSVSGTDPLVAEYIGRSLYLESDYLRQAGNDALAQVRLEQARGLAQAYGFEIGEDAGPRAAMEAFLAAEEERASRG